MIGFIGSFLLLVDPAFTQTLETSTGELWTDVSFRLKMSKKVSTTFTQQTRFDDNISRNYLVAPEISIKYKLKDWWHLEGGYRYKYERDNDADFQNRYRFYTNTRFRLKLKPVTYEFRLQWQKEYRDELDDGSETRHILRSRLKTKLRKVPVVSPYASIEMFQRLDGFDKDISAGTVQKLRYGLGFKWQRGPVELNACYFHVSPIDDSQDLSRNILSLGLRFNIAP